MKAYRREEDYIELSAAEDANYDELIEIDSSNLEWLIALPHLPDKVVPVSEVKGIKVDQVMIGSCRNTSLNDIMSVAKMLEGRMVNSDVDTGLYPSSKIVVREAMKRGYLDTTISSGVILFEAVCG